MTPMPPSERDGETEDFAQQIADQVASFLLVTREISRDDDAGRAISLLLLEISQVLLAGARLGAQRDFAPRSEYQPDVGPEPDLDAMRLRLAQLLGDVDTYSFVFDPYLPEVVEGQLSDDLVSIATDLDTGLRHYRRVVVLREKEADRYLTIWIGADVADAIAFRLQEVTAARPQTHDLLLKMVETLGGTVEAVEGNDLREDTFYATIRVRRGEELLDIDSRPSDAVAVAVRAGVPIYVADEVMDRAGIILDEDGEPIEGAGEPDERPAPPSAEELEKLSAFRDFVAGLDLDDLGEGSR